MLNIIVMLLWVINVTKYLILISCKLSLSAPTFAASFYDHLVSRTTKHLKWKLANVYTLRCQPVWKTLVEYIMDEEISSSQWWDSNRFKYLNFFLFPCEKILTIIHTRLLLDLMFYVLEVLKMLWSITDVNKNFMELDQQINFHVN